MRCASLRLGLLLTIVLIAGMPAIAQTTGFVSNVGQMPDRVLYAAWTSGGVVWVEGDRVVVCDKERRSAFHFEAVGQDAWEVRPKEQLGIVSYFGEKGVTAAGLPAFRRLVLDGRGGVFEVAIGGEGAEVRATRGVLNLGGADNAIRRGVDWEFSSGRASVLTRGPVDVERAGDAWALALGPSGVVSANLLGTFVGVNGAVVTGSGTAVVCGTVYDNSFPTTPGVLQPASGAANNDAIIAELEVGGDHFAWATFISAENDTRARGLVLTETDDPVLTGWAVGPGFPTTPGVVKQKDLGTGDVFISVLAQQGTVLAASTLLGGDLTGAEQVEAIEITPSGDIGVAGILPQAGGFPTTPGAFQDQSSETGADDGFITILSADLTQILVSTLLGGIANDTIHDLAFDDEGRIYVTGTSSSIDFPLTPDAWGPRPGFNDVGAFAARLSADGTTLEASTVVGGPGKDRGYSIDLGVPGEVSVVGLASPTDQFDPPFPVSPNALKKVSDFQTPDFFLAKFTRDLDELLYATRLGTFGQDGLGPSHHADSTGLTIVVGDTQSFSLPITPGAVQTAPEPGAGGDGVIQVVHPSGSRLLYSSYLPLGTTDYDAVAVYPDGDVLVSGATLHTTFPSSPDQQTGTQEGPGAPGAVIRLNLLPAGVERYGTADSTDAGQLVNRVLAQPQVGRRDFGFYCLHARPWSTGWLLMSSAGLDEPLDVAGAELLVDPDRLIAAVPVQATGTGWAERVTPVPDDRGLVGATAFAQWLWPGDDGGWLSSNALRLQVPAELP